MVPAKVLWKLFWLLAQNARRNHILKDKYNGNGQAAGRQRENYTDKPLPVSEVTFVKNVLDRAYLYPPLFVIKTGNASSSECQAVALRVVFTEVTGTGERNRAGMGGCNGKIICTFSRVKQVAFCCGLIGRSRRTYKYIDKRKPEHQGQHFRVILSQLKDMKKAMLLFVNWVFAAPGQTACRRQQTVMSGCLPLVRGRNPLTHMVSVPAGFGDSDQRRKRKADQIYTYAMVLWRLPECRGH